MIDRGAIAMLVVLQWTNNGRAEHWIGSYLNPFDLNGSVYISLYKLNEL